MAKGPMPKGVSCPYDNGRRIYVDVSGHGSVILTDFDQQGVERARIVLSYEAAREVVAYMANTLPGYRRCNLPTTGAMEPKCGLPIGHDGPHVPSGRRSPTSPQAVVEDEGCPTGVSTSEEGEER